MQAARSYVVMTYARCGATWLAQLLGSTGRLGRPEDWFNGQGYRARGHGDYPLDRAGQLAMVYTKGASANGVIGLKLSAVRLRELAPFDWTAGLGDLRFIHLVREDRLARAVSDARAAQTGQYRSTSTARASPRYDAAQIRRFVAEQARDEARIRTWFAVNGIHPLELSYEQLLADQSDVLDRIAAWLGIDGPIEADGSQIGLAIQRDALNREWEERFLAESRGLARFDPLEARLVDRIWSRLHR